MFKEKTKTYAPPRLDANHLRNLDLTRRQAGTLALAVERKTNAHIGAALKISPRTLSKHLERIFSHLRVANRLAGFSLAIIYGKAGMQVLVVKRELRLRPLVGADDFAVEMGKPLSTRRDHAQPARRQTLHKPALSPISTRFHSTYLYS